MSAKRALVVDDSKSARAFLSRILERHEIAVDAAESAEAAIDYLTRHKPDVIFMDHMMPGMDGFQAVQSIKNNPRTSTIPILMYTSQEGDLYLGQARVLGAEGVLPKQIKQADVTKMLYQLRLVSDRRGGEQTTFRSLSRAGDLSPANESAIIVEGVDQISAPPAPASNDANAEGPAESSQFSLLLPKMTLEIRAALDNSLQKEIAALRNYIGATLESHSERLQGDLSALLPATRSPDLDMPTLVPERRTAAIFGWTFAVLALVGAAAMSYLWWNQGAEIAALHTDLDAAYAEVETLRARPPIVSPSAVAEPVDENAVVPAADAPDATSTSSAAVELVPENGVLPPPAAIATHPPATAVAAPPAVANEAPSAAPVAEPQATQAK
ncbi:MAG: response regulator [Pseudomonadota bacterium]